MLFSTNHFFYTQLNNCSKPNSPPNLDANVIFGFKKQSNPHQTVPNQFILSSEFFLLKKYFLTMFPLISTINKASRYQIDSKTELIIARVLIINIRQFGVIIPQITYIPPLFLAKHYQYALVILMDLSVDHAVDYIIGGIALRQHFNDFSGNCYDFSVVLA